MAATTAPDRGMPRMPSSAASMATVTENTSLTSYALPAAPATTTLPPIPRLLPTPFGHPSGAVTTPPPAQRNNSPPKEPMINPPSSPRVEHSLAMPSSEVNTNSNAARAGGAGPVEGRIERRRSVGGGNVGGRQPGHKNYSASEVDHLLNVVEQVEPIGSNMWAIVGETYNRWAVANNFSSRDASMVKQKFDRLANVNKKTGDPSCPPEVRRAKRIARAILGRAHAATLGGTLSSDDESEINGNTHANVGRGNESEDRIGAREGRRASGAGGVARATPRMTNEAALLSCVSQIAEKFSLMSEAYVNRSSVRVEDIVREEVQKAMSSSIDELKALIMSQRSQ